MPAFSQDPTDVAPLPPARGRALAKVLRPLRARRQPPLHLMTNPPGPLDRFRDGLPDGIVPFGEPLGWVCGRCGGRMLMPVAPADTTATDRGVELLLDAASAHRC